MSEFYALPNSAHFWHWPTLIHFALVALAGGMILVTTIASIRNHPNLRRYALVTMVLIVLDLVTLWIESPARFRFTHVWLFLTLTPSAPIWLGGWGLLISLVASFFSYLPMGPKRLWQAMLILGSSLALVYPGAGVSRQHQPPHVDPGTAGPLPTHRHGHRARLGVPIQTTVGGTVPGAGIGGQRRHGYRVPGRDGARGRGIPSRISLPLGPRWCTFERSNRRDAHHPPMVASPAAIHWSNPTARRHLASQPDCRRRSGTILRVLGATPWLDQGAPIQRST